MEQWATLLAEAVAATADVCRPKSARVCHLAPDERLYVPAQCASGVTGYVGMLVHQAGVC